MIYSAMVWQRFMSPGYAGLLTESYAAVGRAESPGGGLVIEIALRAQDNVIREIGFHAYGCPATVAAADWLCESSQGKPVGDAQALSTHDIEKALELAPEKRVCCLVALDALSTALCGHVTVDGDERA